MERTEEEMEYVISDIEDAVMTELVEDVLRELEKVMDERLSKMEFNLEKCRRLVTSVIERLWKGSGDPDYWKLYKNRKMIVTRVCTESFWSNLIDQIRESLKDVGVPDVEEFWDNLWERLDRRDFHARLEEIIREVIE
ncbi:MAG: hypothetical protein DRP01_00665 [Archaeoglobales archaeon]|nr:MAG: hypothetical protein DRP01_00665 [Archaeoglobales archaeon]